MNSYPNVQELTIAILGSSQSGKTSLLKQLLGGGLTEPAEPTYGVEYKSKPFHLGNRFIKLNLWDTGSGEGRAPESLDFFDYVNGFIIVFDISRKESYDEIESFFSQISSKNKQDLPVMILGNKADLEENRQVSTHEGEDIANNHQATYYETSALSLKNHGVAFRNLVLRIADNIEEQANINDREAEDYYY